MTRAQRILFTLLVLAVLPVVTSVLAIEYKPYDGDEGYEEFRVVPAIYFVAYHGNKNAQGVDVQLAWLTRAAEVCALTGASRFMELAYVFEPVLTGDPVLPALSANGYGEVIRVSRVILIPFPIPQADPKAYIDGPSRQGHVRCITVDRVDNVKDRTRLIGVEPILDDARIRGWRVPSSAK